MLYNVTLSFLCIVFQVSLLTVNVLYGRGMW